MGHEIFSLMNQKGIDKNKLIEAINCPKYTNINKIKWGRVFISFDQLEIISNLLGTTIEKLLDSPDAFLKWQDNILDYIDDILVFGIPFMIRRKIRILKNTMEWK